MRCSAPACSGRYSLRQQVRLAAPGYPACTPCCTRQLRATCAYRHILQLLVSRCIEGHASSRDQLGPPPHGPRIGVFSPSDNFAFCCACCQRPGNTPARVRLGTPRRTARTNAPSEIRLSLTLGGLVGNISCWLSRVAHTRPLRRPKMLFLKTGTRTSDMLPLSPHTSDIFRLVLIFADRLCRSDPVASGRGTRLSMSSHRGISCRSKRVACALLRRLKIFSRGSRPVPFALPFQRAFTNRPCRPDPVVSGQGTRLFNSTEGFA